jgi:hypothetical protein
VREQFAASKDQVPEVRFDRRAVLLVEDAISMDLLPGYSLDDEEMEIDLSGLPPTLAEVYVLSMLNAVEQRLSGPVRKRMPHVTFLVPAFDPNFVNWPSNVEKLNLYYEEVMSSMETLDDEEDSHAAGLWGGTSTSSGGGGGSADGLSHGLWGPGSYEEEEELEHLAFGSGLLPSSGSSSSSSGGGGGTRKARRGKQLQQLQQSAASQQLELEEVLEAVRESKSSTVGLAVAATLRRMKLFAALDWRAGRIILEPREMVAWHENKRKAETTLAGQAERLGALTLGDQQRNIRLGISVAGPASSAGVGCMPSPQPWVRRPSMPSSL